MIIVVKVSVTTAFGDALERQVSLKAMLVFPLS
uniref:Uncharacterized protein n=1 Tax=Rhizophora mucronata TaxID=61149 RepID=A0A2P2P5K9_RHIMU